MYVMDKPITNTKLNKNVKNSCQVLLISPGKGIYDYRVNYNIEIGQIVSVPLRNKIYQGIVLGEGSKSFPESKLKDITKIGRTFSNKSFSPVSVMYKVW